MITKNMTGNTGFQRLTRFLLPYYIEYKKTNKIRPPGLQGYGMFLSGLLGISNSTVSNAIRGLEAPNVRIEALLNVHKTLGISIDTLVKVYGERYGK